MTKKREKVSGPTKKLQSWQLVIAILALIAFVGFNYDPPQPGPSPVPKPDIDSIPPPIPKRKKAFLETKYLGPYATIDAHNGNLSVTHNGLIRYANDKISLSVSSNSDSKQYDNLTIGRTIDFGTYTIKLYGIRQNGLTNDIELRIYK